MASVSGKRRRVKFGMATTKPQVARWVNVELYACGGTTLSKMMGQPGAALGCTGCCRPACRAG
jgi:hypothetical protein